MLAVYHFSRLSTPVFRTSVSVAALMTALPAWADGGNGFSNVPNNSIGGLGGVDGSLADATGKNAGHTNSGETSAGDGGGGAVDLTTGNGAPGGARGTFGTTGLIYGTAGATGSTGLFVTAPTVISTTVSGGNGSAGEAATSTSTLGGGGGGGVGVSATSDITITGLGIVVGGSGFGDRNAGAGGGGVGVFSSANVTVDSGGQITGGAGGGWTGSGSAGGAGGGAAAILLTNGGVVQNAGTLTGGAGGQSLTNAFGAGGGDGGAGVQLLTGGTVINLTGGTILGGAGGTGRNAPAANPPYSPGDGGAGIKGANMAIVNAGTIAGGAGGTGAGGWAPVAGSAIEFTGGVNSLEIWSTSNIVGNVAAFSVADTFKLGGATDASFDLSQIGASAKYEGFGLYDKVGTSTWTLTGTTAVAAPWTIYDGTLAVNTVLGGTMSVIGGRLQGIGTVGDTTNFAGGTIAPGNSIGTLTIAGNYIGQGGTLEIEAVLGGDASPADLLIVTGNTAGSTNVRVINVGGAGAQTVEGIKIIDVGGASNGNFALLGDYVFKGQQAIVAGAYGYVLQKNGISTPSDGDWYLRSQLIDSADPAPIYQPGVPVLEAYPQILLGMNGLPTLQQRVGNRLWLGAGADTTAALEEKSSTHVDDQGVWARLEGERARVKPKASSSGAAYDYDTFKLDAGLDGELHESGSGALIGGVMLHYGHASADVSSLIGDGSIGADGYGLRGTLTWYGVDGLYVDAQGQLTWYNSDLQSALLGQLAKSSDALGHALSLEGGQVIKLNNGLTTTPQAQLTYSSINFDDFAQTTNGRNVANVSLIDGDSLRGRLGISLDQNASWHGEGGMLSRSHVYGIANVYYEFLEGTAVSVSGVPFANQEERFWGGIGLGASQNWSDDKYSVYGEGSIDTSLVNFADSYSFRGTAGFRMKW